MKLAALVLWLLGAFVMAVAIGFTSRLPPIPPQTTQRFREWSQSVAQTQQVWAENCPVLFINVRQARARRTHFEQQVAHFQIRPVVRLEAVTPSQVHFQNPTCSRIEKACTLSHLKAAEWLNSHPEVDMVLVCEDDALWDMYPHWPHNLTTIVSALQKHDPEWEMLQLFSNKTQDYDLAPASDTPWFRPALPYSGTVAYVLHRRGAERWLRIELNHPLSPCQADHLLLVPAVHRYTFLHPYFLPSTSTTSSILPSAARDQKARQLHQFVQEYFYRLHERNVEAGRFTP